MKTEKRSFSKIVYSTFMVMAEIGGPLAHQLPLHNHHGGLVQPSLVMNHHLDLECHGADIQQSKLRFVSLFYIKTIKIPVLHSPFKCI